MLLKDYNFNNLKKEGCFGLSIRCNNDTKQLNESEDIGECLKEIERSSNCNAIANSKIIGERNFFNIKVLVIDYQQN